MRSLEHLRKSAGQAFVFLGLVALAAALLAPRLVIRERDHRMDQAQASVSALRDALVDHARAEGDFPPDAPPGRVPEELRPFLDPGVVLEAEWFRLDVQRWEQLVNPDPPLGLSPRDTIAPPPPRMVGLGGITLHSPDTVLLASLLEAWGRRRSFVRDTSWTLVLAPDSSADGGP